MKHLQHKTNTEARSHFPLQQSPRSSAFGFGFGFGFDGHALVWLVLGVLGLGWFGLVFDSQRGC